MTQATELEDLWVRLCATRDPALRDRMIVQYAPLVKYVVGRMAVSMPGVSSSEICSSKDGRSPSPPTSPSGVFSETTDVLASINAWANSSELIPR